MYAGRKRRKPVQRAVKAPPTEGVKSNPSKRHRDRLNSELERLARLLPFPEEVTSSLDKLSILRLSVSYLRAKNFFTVALKNHTNSSNHDNSKATGLVDGWLPEGELLLQALSGFVLVVTSEGIIFYASHTIQDYLGFHQTDVMHQSVFELIHTEDQQAFRRNLHWALNPPSTAAPTHESPQDGDGVSSSALVTYNPEQLPPENSSFLERSFVCRFRCLLDNSSGFLALNLQGRLKFLHGQNRRLDDGGQVPPQLALFAVATPLQPPSILEIRTKNMIFRTKHKLDFTPMACDAKGKIVLGYTEAELRVRGTGYQFIHAADMLYCAENHVRMIKTGESGLTVFRLLTKDNRWKWVQANARLVYKNGKPDYIIATQRPLGEEEGGEHLRKRSMHLPFTFATGEALLYETSYPIPGFPNNMLTKGKSGRAKKGKGDKGFKDSLDPSSLLGAMMRQDESVYVCQPAVEPKLPYHSSLFGELGQTSAFSATGERWDCVPDTITGGSKPDLSSFDPLLSTLDSLSLESEENCSNSELFNALENLGLNAEDLELLLLDERMIRVEMEPHYIPSLNDLLTNNEILSYIHDSLENQTVDSTCDGDSQVPVPVPDLLDPVQGPSEPYVPPPGPVTEPDPTAVSSTYLPYHLSRQVSPILQLSQQMQQHLSAQSLHNKCHTWIPEPQGSKTNVDRLPQNSSGLVNAVTGVHNGHWIPQHTQASLDDPTEVNSKLPETNKQQQSWQDGQLQSQCPYKQKPSHESDPHNGVYSDAQWQGYNFINQVDPSASGSCAGNSHVDYNIATGSGMEFTMNSNSVGDICQFQGVVATSSSFQQVYQKQQQPKAPPTFFSYTNQNSSLEHILVLPPPQELPSLDAYEIFDSAPPHDTIHSKTENGCVLNSTSVAYTANCLLPNGTVATAPNNSPHPRPEPLPPIPDPQTTGFYL
ncbi:aryl hydrocarbon receptor 1b [Colossoma macropomum]|uniref:aryl hydrocarbon receptor 1b n=1 Tax=Colossoma macropomum TaxID=42526 RepID=UPI001864B7E1|nr:aryl hydrocarbon receptor 1b [Colossoma macropomum]